MTLPPQAAPEPRNFAQTMRNALIITRREVRDSFRDWRILAPIIILTFLFPVLAQLAASRFMNFVMGYGAEIIGERTIPFMLMIVGFFPISISLVIALETFVGEKERRSLEPLLSTPLSNTELYIGKTLAAMIPPLISSYGGMFMYLGSLLFSELAWRPQPMLLVQIILLTTLHALVMVTGSVVVSSQTTSTRAANLLASFIIIPIALLVQGESFIMFIAPDAESPRGIGTLWILMAALIVIVVLLLRLGNSIFNREELLGRSIDQLNLRGTLRNLWNSVRAVDEQGRPAKNLLEWFRLGIPLSLRRLGGAVPVVLIVFVGMAIFGVWVGQQPQWQLPMGEVADFSTVNESLGGFLNLSTQTGALAFFVWQNARVLLIATGLSMFTLGVGGVVLSSVVFLVFGYFLSQLAMVENGVSFFLAAIVPHGIVEIPVIVIAIAAGLKLGASLTLPPRGMTVGQGWTQALSDTIRLGLGVVLPGLVIGALLEAFVTPAVLLALIGG
jgi:uncharacterized membrane protein SpoIIM required for sporulation/ABC-type transport system involved in multi-copper enzyme maturation permease subunit